MADNTGWVAGRGVGFTYTTCSMTATSFNSLAVGSCVIGTTAIDNTTALDLYADVSFSLVNGSTTVVAGAYFSLYILPLNQDGTTYGDGIATGTTLPSAQYLVSSVGAKVGAGSGATLTGTFRGILLPPRKFYFGMANNMTGALNASAAATVSYTSYNESLNS